MTLSVLPLAQECYGRRASGNQFRCPQNERVRGGGSQKETRLWAARCMHWPSLRRNDTRLR